MIILQKIALVITIIGILMSMYMHLLLIKLINQKMASIILIIFQILKKIIPIKNMQLMLPMNQKLA